MRSTVAVLIGVVCLVACAATPELDYGDGRVEPSILHAGDGGDGRDDAGRVGEAGTPTTGVDASGAGGGDSGGTRPPPPPIDSGHDPGADAAAPACPLVVARGVDCCASPTGPRTCVGQACLHCADCLQSGYKASEFCCAKMKSDEKYKGVYCAASSGC